MKTGTYALMTGWLSLAGGAVAAEEFQFLPAVTVNENAPGEDGPYSAEGDAAMAVDSQDNLHVAWVGVRADIRDIYSQRRADGRRGVSFCLGDFERGTGIIKDKSDRLISGFFGGSDQAGRASGVETTQRNSPREEDESSYSYNGQKFCSQGQAQNLIRLS